MRKTRRVAGLTALAAVVVTTLAVTPSAFGWTVTMTAQPELTRTHAWSIAKTASVETLSLKAGETAVVGYSVTVTHTGSTDSGWGVAGSVSYSADPDITIGSVSAFATPPGATTPQTAGTITCDPSPFPITLVSGLVCDYEIALPNANPGDAHARAVLTDPVGGRHVTRSFDFSTATVNEIDECIDVTDTYAGNLGTVCVGDAPKTFTYNRTIGPYSSCGEHLVTNTASFVTNDTGATGSSTANVAVTVLCDSGCTRTIGYWKNHAGVKRNQADVVTALLPIWLGTAAGAKSVLVDSADEAVQYLEMKGTNNVHDSENGINKLYAQLLGAKLNAASGTGTASIAAVIAAADAFLATKNTLDWAGLSAAQQSQVLSWMTSLDNWNNGLLGPEHCD